METTVIKRKFKANVEGKEILLNDPDPDMTLQEVKSFYSSQYPELTNANINGPVSNKEGTEVTYSLDVKVGTKG